jgi:ATP phosphoribosyltransferase regulatory subunit
MRTPDMPTHTPSFPDLLFEDAARLRRWETLLMDHLGHAGYRELRPSLVMRTPDNPATVRFFDGDQLVALRWDFTEALARTLVRRFQDPPDRLSYAGPVFRRPANAWDPVERFEVGCERIQSDRAERGEADRELAQLLMAVPGLLGLEGCLLHLGHGALLRRPLQAEGIPAELGLQVAQVLDRRAIHRAAELLQGLPARERLLQHAEVLLSGPDGPGCLAALAHSPYGPLLEAEMEQLSRVTDALTAKLPEGLTLRLDLGDLRGMGYYSGPTLRLWAPGAQREIASGGRYDGVYPELGRPWFAAGFCVRLTTLLELGETKDGDR